VITILLYFYEPTTWKERQIKNEMHHSTFTSKPVEGASRKYKTKFVYSTQHASKSRGEDEIYNIKQNA